MTGPDGAAVLSGRPVGIHSMPGLGVRFVSGVLNRAILDEVIAVTDEDAMAAARRLARMERIMAGMSSGAAVRAALAIAARQGAEGKMVVVVLPDSAERYVTTASSWSSGYGAMACHSFAPTLTHRDEPHLLRRFVRMAVGGRPLPCRSRAWTTPLTIWFGSERRSKS